MNSKAKKNSTSKPAFTLLETLLAIGLAAMVIVVALVTLRHISSTRQRLDTLSELNCSGKYVLDRIRNDLANIYHNQSTQQPRFIATESAGTHTPTRLLFQTAQHTFAKNDQPVGDLYEIEYTFEPSPNNREHFILARRSAPLDTPTQTNTQGQSLNRKVILANNITEFTLEYNDNENWLSYWNTTDELPKSIRISFTVVDNKSNLSLQFSQTIGLSPLTLNNSFNDETLNVPLSPDNLPENLQLP